MKVTRFLFLCAAGAALAACTKTVNETASSGSLTCEPLVADTFSIMSKKLENANIAVNQVPITSSCGYTNEPCVSVTICAPGTADCQTIDNILLDTGSEGLRLFSCVVTVGLTAQTISGNPVGECVTYADTSQQWGSVQMADVTLGSETASNVPVQIIDATFQSVPTVCSNLDYSAAKSGFNGILGVGMGAQDCGSACTLSNNDIYFSCSSGNCSSVSAAVSKQVANPVYALGSALYNNGVVIDMPSISSSGDLSPAGNMYLGISSGSGSNNEIGSASAYFADTNHRFRTTYNSTVYTSSFIDSGSNGLFFPTGGSIPACGPASGVSGFLCPTSTLTLSATMDSAFGYSANPTAVNFFIANGVDLISTGNNTFYNLGGNFTGAFDWGYPFFFGRRVLVGFDGRSSNLGTGPYWAW